MSKKSAKEKREKAMQSSARRHARKRKLRLGRVFALLVLIILIVFGALSITILFPVQSIYVAGESVYSPDEIKSASGIEIGNNTFLLSSKEIQKKIITHLPYIESVKLQKSLVGSIGLKVTAAKGYITLKSDDGYVVVSQSGKALEKVTEVPENYIIISGMACNGVTVGHNISFEDKNSQDIFSQLIIVATEYNFPVKHIDVSDINKITMQIENRFIVDFGTSANLSYKAKHLSVMLKQMNEFDKGHIDLSYWTTEKPEGYFRRSDSIPDYTDNSNNTQTS